MIGSENQKEVDFIPEDFPSAPGEALILLFGAVLVGIVTGLLGIAFLLLLRQGDALREVLTNSLHAWPPFMGWLALSLTVALATCLASWMVERFAPTAQGSGIPYVEKILRGNEQPRHAWVIPVKFVGGWLALSAGLILGREGPMVQMGAVVGEKLGHAFPGLKGSWKSLMAAGAGAGLASAFNAPVGGTIFILEEVFRKITPLTFILTATAASVSVWLQRAIFHMPQDYAVPDIPQAPAAAVWLFFLFGTLIGLLGVFYNRLMLALTAFAGNLKNIPVTMRGAVIGFLVGSITWFVPQWVGGGDDITQSILASKSHVWLLLGIASLRFFVGPISYSAGTPGGLFAPIIALGAIVGSASGALSHSLLPELVPSQLAFAVAGMAAFFTATIRAPLTGIVICLEMTGCYSLFFPMLATCLGAYLIPTLLKDTPIYDAFAKRK
ncbi:MAG: H(+)/Cl(-) exchange transporter ClcA [bacterium]